MKSSRRIRKATVKSHFLSAATVLAIGLGAADRVCAQSIDYASLEQLFNEPVTTSATGSPLRVTDAPADMTIITQEDIRRSGATDLPTILSRVPGIDVLNWSADVSDVGVRGYDQAYSPRLLVLIDGREVYLDDFGRTAWATLPVTLPEIRQIEVVRGPNSALFGFNAVAGVINIITFNPKYDNVNSIEAHGGTQGNVGGSGLKTLRFGDRISTRLSVGAERQDEWKNTAGYSNPWNAHAMADVAVQLAPKTELRLQGSLSRSSLADMPPSSTYVPADYTVRSVMATIASETRYGQIQARAYLNDLDNIERSRTLGRFDVKNRIVVASLQDLFKIGPRNTVRLAFEYRDNAENTTPIEQGRVGYRVLAPAAMWNISVSTQLSLTAAARLDHLDLRRTGSAPAAFYYTQDSLWQRSIDSVSANFGAVYRISEFDTLRATYGRGIQSPTLIEYGGLQATLTLGPSTIALGGTPYLRPTVVSNYQLSYDRIVPSLNAKASAKVFVQQTDDVMGIYDFTRPLIGPPPARIAEVVFANASRSTMAGFELAASGTFGSGFRWSADTTYTRVTDQPIGGRTDLIAPGVAFSRTTPQFRGNVAAGWSHGRWDVDSFVHYVSAYDAYNPAFALVRTPAYAALGVRLAYQLPDGLTIAASGQNLGAARQNQGSASGLSAERRVVLSLSKTW